MKLNKKRLEHIFSPGTVVELSSTMIDNNHPIKKGTKGTVKYIDDLPSIKVVWETGSTLALLPEIDNFSILDTKKNLEWLIYCAEIKLSEAQDARRKVEDFLSDYYNLNIYDNADLLSDNEDWCYGLNNDFIKKIISSN